MSDEILSPDELEALIETGEPDRAAIETEVLETAGITSKVEVHAPETETGVDVEGHILLADYDDDISFPRDGDEDLSRFERVEREARELDGITAILESSPGSYHVWCLTVENLSERILQALAMHGDPMHVAVSWRRSMFVLRCAPKTYSRSIDEGEPVTYKDAPELIGIYTSESDRPQSRGHFEMLRTLADHQGPEPLEAIEDVDLDRYEWVGERERITVSRYLTVTDELKREVW